MNPPILTISLDFELHWGRFDKYPLESSREYYFNTRKAIPRILALFERNQIHATWATVGMLFAQNLEEWNDFGPIEKPNYSIKKYSAYHWMAKQKNIDPDCIFAPELIRNILETENQEIGSHTFSHFYTCESGQTLDQFRGDLIAAKNIAKDKFGISLNSLVFPRNQFDDNALEVVKSEGFSVVRSNPIDWYWKNTHMESIVKKVFRTGDTLIQLGKKSSYKLPVNNGTPVQLPASRLLRPYKSNSLFNKIRIDRIKDEMTLSAQQGEVYHLWWHPHNFGHHPEENLFYLQEILVHFSELRSQYGLKSLNMKETAALVFGS